MVGIYYLIADREVLLVVLLLLNKGDIQYTILLDLELNIFCLIILEYERLFY